MKPVSAFLSFEEEEEMTETTPGCCETFIARTRKNVSKLIDRFFAPFCESIERYITQMSILRELTLFKGNWEKCLCIYTEFCSENDV